MSSDEYEVVSVQKRVDGSTALTLFSATNKEVQVGTTFIRLSPSFSFTVADVQSNGELVAQIASAAYVVTPDSFVAGSYPVDTILESAGKEYTVIANDGTNLLVLPADNGTLSVGSVLNIQGTGVTFTIAELVEPAFDRKTGDLLFIDNRAPFSQTEDQTVTFRTVIQY